ncbi:hypothetical protein WI28_16535 [Burkholderia diffusa]|uniref:hypothetical protein n=1 Tax=Burkholderia diffusa TaxID=488732 RepID=UPI000758D1DE|nr:hypothetical protein [Burkholderia diffusa]KUZ11506.1 hypothetical protein WI28_16535 [Burkholderia diffusa]
MQHNKKELNIARTHTVGRFLNENPEAKKALNKREYGHTKACIGVPRHSFQSSSGMERESSSYSRNNAGCIKGMFSVVTRINARSAGALLTLLGTLDAMKAAA